VNFGLLFQGADFFHKGYLTHEIWPKLIPEFCELWSGVPVIPCGDMHQFFTRALVKWFFNNFPTFADSFRLVSIDCVARRLGASFLYKCLASHGSSLRQHGLLVFTLD